MYEGHSVGVVVPAYNEAPFVGDVIADIPGFVDHIYAIDDASTDETMAAIREAARERAAPAERSGGESDPTSDDSPARTPPVSHDGGQQRGFQRERVGEAESIGRTTCIQHATNRGAGGAIKTGYVAALEDGMDIVATIDGDGQMDSTTLSGLLDPLVAGEAGYAKGNRFHDRTMLREMPPFRLFGNLALTGLTRVSTGYWGLYDPQNGFTAATREALVAAEVGSIWEYYGYMNQLTARLNVAGVDIADVPMETVYGDEESDIDYGQYIRKVSGMLAGTLVRRLGQKDGPGATATAACYLLAIVCLVGGTLAALHPAREFDGRAAATVVLGALGGGGVGALVDSASDPVASPWEGSE